MDDFIVTIGDVRKVGHCTAGIRRWAGVNGLDFRDFLKNGISAARLLESGDAMALDVVTKLKERGDVLGG